MTITGADGPRKIVVLNPKGGCGKTTLATNLASCYAQRGLSPLLVDCDPQGFCMRWLANRPDSLPPIHGVEAFEETIDFSRFERPAAYPGTGPIIFDLPAAIAHERLHHYTYSADSVLVPIVPSAVDVFSGARLIAELLLDAQLDRRLEKLAIVANRVRRNTRSYRMLLRFLNSLEIPLIATLRDSQNYVFAAERGLGVCELPAYRADADTTSVKLIVTWLSQRKIREHTTNREALIAAAAYRRAEQRGFQGGDPESDWLEAEREVDTLIKPQLRTATAGKNDSSIP